MPGRVGVARGAPVLLKMVVLPPACPVPHVSACNVEKVTISMHDHVHAHAASKRNDIGNGAVSGTILDQTCRRLGEWTWLQKMFLSEAEDD